jgi:hypothetical protein
MAAGLFRQQNLLNEAKEREMNISKFMPLALAGMMLVITFGVSASGALPQVKTTVVTDENFSLAETDGIMTGYVKKLLLRLTPVVLVFF